MWELDHNGWAPKNCCFWTVVLKKALESRLDCKEIKPVNPHGNKPWLFIGKTEAEAPMLWAPMQRANSIRKDLDAGYVWWQEEKGTREDEMASLAQWKEFYQAPGDGEGQEAWHAAVHGVKKSWTWLSDWRTANVPEMVYHSCSWNHSWTRATSYTRNQTSVGQSILTGLISVLFMFTISLSIWDSDSLISF